MTASTPPNLGPTSVVHPSASVYARPFGDEVVLLEFGRGEYFGLDPIGASVWNGLVAGDSLGRIAHAIASTYEVSEQTALTDIVVLVQELREHALVTEHPSA